MKPQSKRIPFPLRYCKELQEKPKPIIENVLATGETLCFSGPIKEGKSVAMLGLATALSTGGTWFGHQCHKCKVLLIDAVMHEWSIVERLHDLGITETMDADVWNLCHYDDYICVDGEKKFFPLSLDLVETYGHLENYDVVIIDPLYKFKADTEEAAIEAMEKLTNLAYKYNIAIVHTRNAEPNFNYELELERGSTVLMKLDKEIPHNLCQQFRAEMGDYEMYRSLITYESFDAPHRLWHVAYDYPALYAYGRFHVNLMDRFHKMQYVHYDYPHFKEYTLNELPNPPRRATWASIKSMAHLQEEFESANTAAENDDTTTKDEAEHDTVSKGSYEASSSKR